MAETNKAKEARAAKEAAENNSPEQTPVTSVEETPEVVQKTPEQLAEENRQYLNEMVERTLFMDDGLYKDPVFVALNGQNYLIKRGEPVMMPRKIAMIIDEQEEMRKKQVKLIQKYEADYRAAQDFVNKLI